VSQIQLGSADISAEGRNNNVLLSVRNLRVEFKKQRGFLNRQTITIRAVDNLSFDVRESELISIVGESGSGKTTVARCILGLTRPTTGSIMYNGVDVSKLKGNALLDYRRQVQVIYQDPFESLDPGQDVYTTISIPIKRLTGEKDGSSILERVRELLDEVGLEAAEVMHRYPHQLSGGQRQRVNICRALASNPKLLIADEPITMLDAAQRLNILTLLMDLKARRNLTVVMITHDLHSAQIVSQRTLVMYLGKLVEAGSTESILTRPLHPYVELILESAPKLEQAKVSSSVFKDDRSISWIEESDDVTKGCVFRPRCKYAMSICSEEEPALEEKKESHYAACFNPLKGDERE
jgi:oligopeptide/dipeptide ABC transporter ATP-binding protein